MIQSSTGTCITQAPPQQKHSKAGRDCGRSLLRQPGVLPPSLCHMLAPQPVPTAARDRQGRDDTPKRQGGPELAHPDPSPNCAASQLRHRANRSVPPDSSVLPMTPPTELTPSTHKGQGRQEGTSGRARPASERPESHHTESQSTQVLKCRHQTTARLLSFIF